MDIENKEGIDNLVRLLRLKPSNYESAAASVIENLMAYKQSAEAKIKEYEQATKLSGEVNAKLVGELLEMQDKVAAMESQKPCETLLEVDEENMSYEYFDIHEHIPVGTDLYMKPVQADKPAVADVAVSTLERVAGGLENQIGNADLRNDLYDAGYLRAIKREVLRLRDTLAVAQSHSQQSAEVDRLRAFADEVKQLCSDFSDLQNRPYMGDVTSAIDGLYEQFNRCPSHESEEQ